jgi:hypothetical protein
MGKKIGVLVGREWSFPPAFLEAAVNRGTNLTAEYVKLGTPFADELPAYDLILDRISHEVGFYRTYLRHAELRGIRVINSPHDLDGLDRFVAASHAARLGIPVPATALLPHRDYAPEIVHEESLRNLDYPLDWQRLVERVGSPFLLRDARRESGADDHVCGSVEDLLWHYDRSARRLMMVQAQVPGEQHLRCLVIGTECLPLAFDPPERKYGGRPDQVPPELRSRMIRDSLAFCASIGLDINAVDWAVSGDSAHAVELLNPVPELDVYALPGEHFDRAVDSMAALAVALVGALDTTSQAETGVADSKPPVTAVEETGPDGAGDLAEGLGSLAQGLPGSKLV